MAPSRRTARNRARLPRGSSVKRTAWHEAGHAVLSAAINELPKRVSILANGETLGRSIQRGYARPSSLTQVYLAGFAAEQLLAGRPPRRFRQEVGFALLSLSHPELREAIPGSEHRDVYRAVRQLLKMGVRADDEALKREVERFYGIALESLTAVLPAVKAVAAALLKHEELSRRQLEETLAPLDVVEPVLRIQRAHGLLLSGATARRLMSQ